MIKIFDEHQIRKIDTCTIKNKNISSIDLMESAALCVYKSLVKILDFQKKIIVFAGIGNNGGDALALARMLLEEGFLLEVYLVGDDDHISKDCKINRVRLEGLINVKRILIESNIPTLNNESTVIDGLFGSGLNRPLDGIFAKLVQVINRSGAKVYSIDMPSGLFVDNNNDNNIEFVIKSDELFSFQFPKISLLLPQDEECYKKMHILDIGLCEDCIEREITEYFYLECFDVKKLVTPRALFSHKGTYGHALLIVGSRGKMGSAVLASRSCMKTGVGLLTVHSPGCGVDILQTTIPEAMVDVDSNFEYVSNIDIDDLSKYTIGIGSGIGQCLITKELLVKLFTGYRNPMIIDADALNLISADDELKERMPSCSILTPHPVEFERLIGLKCKTGYDRLLKAREFAYKYNVYIILKGASTAIITPSKEVYFNSTGNPGMATAGSGDVLTGILTSLLAQKYEPFEAALLGVYLHGLAGDLGSKRQTERSLLASDIIENISNAYKYIQYE